ncbi:hypothetical protein ABT024_32185 [Streptomyces sp. NPDC002812]|uniref:hypothetical protein n=1 Tax=Streptomyces sp. NPDC002812 TaxID=3154434 RepID=UPI00331BD545
MNAAVRQTAKRRVIHRGPAPTLRTTLRVAEIGTLRRDGRTAPSARGARACDGGERTERGGCGSGTQLCASCGVSACRGCTAPASACTACEMNACTSCDVAGAACATCAVSACRGCNAPASACRSCEMNACRSCAGNTCAEAAPTGCSAPAAATTPKGSCATGNGGCDCGLFTLQVPGATR